MLRAVSVKRAGEPDAPSPFDVAVLAQDERHVRRRVITLEHGDKVLVDFAEAMMLGDGDLLVLADGRHAGIVAAEEELYEIRGRDAVHRAELAWHIGNRHLAAAIEPDRILILRDHVIRAMLEGLGATVRDTVEIFRPVRGAYSGHQHDHARDHTHGHHHDHGHHHHE
jgi:urease accessory protein